MADYSGGGGRMPAILDGEFFKIVSRDGDKVVAKCMKCSSNKTYSGLISATTNFLAHLKRVHPSLIEKFHSHKIEALKNRKRRRTSNSASPERKKQRTVEEACHADKFSKFINACAEIHENKLKGNRQRKTQLIRECEQVDFQATDNQIPTWTTQQIEQLPADIKIELNEEDVDPIPNLQYTCDETDFGTDDEDRSHKVEIASIEKMTGKRKTEEVSACEEENSLQVMEKYCERNSRVSTSTAAPGDDYEVFYRFLELEMRKVQDLGIRRSMMRKLMNLVMDAQEEEERKQLDQGNSGNR